MGGFVTLKDLGVRIEYFSSDIDEKNRICDTIIKKTLDKITVKLSYVQKLSAIDSLLLRSITYNEKIEDYLACEILKDVHEYLIINYLGEYLKEKNLQV